MSRNRKDAKRVDMPGLMQCAIDLKPGRLENEVYINKKIDVTNLVKYVEEKKAQGIKYTYFNAFATAIGKVIYNRPKLNRFVANRHMYEHNEVTLSFVAKIALNDRSEEIMLIVKIDPEDTIDTITAKLNEKIDHLRNSKKVSKKGANSAIDKLCKLPNFIRVPIFGIIKSLDRKGKLPKALSNDLIYYSSMIISNLGSIHCGAIYHNLANFGTCSSLTSMGEILPEYVKHDDGTEEKRYFCEFGITLDERIGDGYYYAQSSNMIAYILDHPQMLEEPANQKIELPR